MVSPIQNVLSNNVTIVSPLRDAKYEKERSSPIQLIQNPAITLFSFPHNEDLGK